VLPFLTRQNLFLAPIGLIGLLFLLGSLAGVNASRLVLGVFVS
jgi:hypothetical protein